MDLQTITQTALPAGEEVAALFIHNPTSVAKYTAIFSTVNELAPVLAALIEKLFAKKPAAAPAAEPTASAATEAAATPAAQ